MGDVLRLIGAHSEGRLVGGLGLLFVALGRPFLEVLKELWEALKLCVGF